MATTRNWLGGQHDFFAAGSWTAAGWPVAGDTAIIGLGTGSGPNIATVRNATLGNIHVVLDAGTQAASQAATPTLSLSNAVIGSGTVIDGQTEFNVLDPSTQAFLRNEAIAVSGAVSNQGTIDEQAFSNELDIALSANAVLTNQAGGVISAANYDTLAIKAGAGAKLVNNGTVSGHGSAIDVAAAVSGHGVFALTAGSGFNSHTPNPSTLEFHGAVGSGQTITLNNAVLVLDAAPSFLATIDDRHVAYAGGPAAAYAGNSSVLLKGGQATALSFQNNVLTVVNGANVLAHLAFAAGLARADFALTDTAQGARIDIASPTPSGVLPTTAATSVGLLHLPSHA